MYVVQSLTNCLIDITHCDKLMKLNLDFQKGLRLNEDDVKRKAIYVEGGHNIFVVNFVWIFSVLS